LRFVLAAFFVGAGAYHFVAPEFYLPMLPPYLPSHLELVYISGVFEIVGGLGLLLPQTRRFAALGLIALLLAVFPANIHMALNQISPPGLDASPLALWLRLPLQFVMMGWAWWVRAD
jgi:uncharacterized membrane protein